MKRLIRTVQTRFPFMLDLKLEGQRVVRRALKRPSERVYAMFKTFPFPDGSVFLDIGANHGQTIDSFRLYNTSARLHAFEPNALLAGKLTARYRSDRDTVINPFGLADEEGEFQLHVPFYRNFLFDGLASFDVEAARSWLSPQFIHNFDPSLVRVEQINCYAKRLDDLDLQPALAKIDVQGFETQVLRGGTRTIDRCRPVFIIENDEAMRHADLLADLDYAIAAFETDRFHLHRPGVVNSVFIPREKVAELTARFDGARGHRRNGSRVA